MKLASSDRKNPLVILHFHQVVNIDPKREFNSLLDMTTRTMLRQRGRSTAFSRKRNCSGHNRNSLVPACLQPGCATFTSSCRLLKLWPEARAVRKLDRYLARRGMADLNLNTAEVRDLTRIERIGAHSHIRGR